MTRTDTLLPLHNIWQQQAAHTDGWSHHFDWSRHLRECQCKSSTPTDV